MEFLDGRPVSVVFPDVLELKDTAPPTRQQANSNFKTAKLEHTEVLSQCVKTGDVIRLHVETLKSMQGRMPGQS